jgi:leucyl/phenylalanyl-tRNA--protein transferase
VPIFALPNNKRELSSAGLEHLPYKQRVGGSNPSAPTKTHRNVGFIFFSHYVVVLITKNFSFIKFNVLQLHILTDKIWFPPVESASEDGLLAMGGDVKPERLIYAYQQGIFPWYSDSVPLWWHPNPRFILLPQELKVSKSMQQLLKQNKWQFTINKAFEQVIVHCRRIPRKNQDGTWITDDIQQSYIQLHTMGYAHSAEVWEKDELIGGLYGVKMGKVFFGESMFSKKSNASKYAFIKFVQQLIEEGVELIDCQVYTEHLESLGAKMILRQQFMQLLKHLLK